MCSKKIAKPAKEQLESLYNREGTTISSLATEFSTSNTTVRKWLISYDIERKSHQQASAEANNRHRASAMPTKDELVERYLNSTIKELEAYYSVSQRTIYQWLEQHHINLRTPSEACKTGKEKQYADIQFTKEFLEERYDKTKAISHLADQLGVSRGHISSLFDKHGIQRVDVEPPYRSNAETQLYDYLVSQFPDDDWSSNNKKIIAPYELDIVNHDKKIAVEYCGLYWHSETGGGKHRKYHRMKYLACVAAGYKLITVFESDDMEKVRSLLLKLLGKTTRVFARKTVVKSIDSKMARGFHDRHHMHSSVGASENYGLFYQGELVMVGSFGKNRFSKNHQYECTRLTTNGHITVVGGVSKIFKKFIRDIDPESVITFADLRFGDGRCYLNCGFVKEADSDPNYRYFKRNTQELFSRVKFQKHKLEAQLDVFDIGKTEYENMVANNWDRIWDCGNAKYTYKKAEPKPRLCSDLVDLDSFY